MTDLAPCCQQAERNGARAALEFLIRGGAVNAEAARALCPHRPAVVDVQLPGRDDTSTPNDAPSSQ